ncbi:MAG: sodium:proton antiporter [Planctomycetaceae bacterium]|nr:sodium:proton antiporter [Planctomycetaceae bacterium]
MVSALFLIVVAYAVFMAVNPSRGAPLPSEHVETPTEPHDSEHGDKGHALATAPAAYSVIPFAALLGCIALLPLIHATGHWWEHNRNKFLVAAGLGVVTLAYYAFVYGHGVHDHLSETTSAAGFPAAVTVVRNAILNDYIPFMTLLFCLYVISGGISIDGSLVGRPSLNVRFLGLGAVLASFIGTTGAAMLLIRPLIKANARRRRIVHTVVFFIFIVCNTGGCLLPLGDPPLFLGYLKGVPFLWTFNLAIPWAFANGVLLAVYFAWDSLLYRREDESVKRPDGEPQPLGIRGAVNFAWLAGVIAAVAILVPGKPLPGTNWATPLYFREAVMLTLAALSLLTTSIAVRASNHFHYGAILEVAALFSGIFICMQAPIEILNVHGAELGIDRPWKYFWGSGTLSSFLDNAPTYVVFFETARAAAGDAAGRLVQPVGVDFTTLMAISLGSVFMGANTYIGNGPNFMVKAIAEANNIRMPSFFGYMAYSCGILIPLFVVVTFVFFR